MRETPSGTVTFLFTDVEDSSRLWDHYPIEMQAALERHDLILRSAIEANDGYVFTTAGDSFAAAFQTADAAAQAALNIQHEVHCHPWGEQTPIRVRIGVHTGEADERGGDYFGPAVNRAARIEVTGHGGQILVSGVTAGVLAGSTRAVWNLTELGNYQLKGLDRLESIYQLDARAVIDFGPLRVSVPGDSSTAGGSQEPANPYKGLRTFSEADAGDFYGREQLTQRLADAVEGSRFLTVVGPSGSGKSSAVRAGLIPHLRTAELEGRGSWVVASMIPGSHPYEELEAALLRVAPNPPNRLLDLLREDERGLVRAIKRVLPNDNSELLLFVDQFEELFTLTDSETRDRFLDALAAVATDERSRTRLLCTIRADYYDRPLGHPAISELVRDHNIAITPLTREELVEAVTEPVAKVGIGFDPALVNRIVGDVISSPGSLPMLQYTLTDLFEHRSGGVITDDEYDALGGINGAITARAEDIYSRLGPDEQRASRRLFGRLVNLGDRSETTRRRVERADLERDTSATIAIDAYGDARLLAFDQDSATNSPTVEVAHEALIREWQRLQQWIEEDHDHLRTLHHLTSAANAWHGRGREPADLYRGARLDSAREFSATLTELTPLEIEFVKASEADADAELAREKRGLRRLRKLTGISLMVAMLALVASGLALQQRARANDKTEQAERLAYDAELRRMSAEALSLRDTDPALSLLTAVAVHRLNPGPQSLGLLQRTLTRTDGLLGFLGAGVDYQQVVFADENTLLARTRGRVDVWNIDNRELRLIVELDGQGEVQPLSPSQAIAVGSDGSIVVLDLITGDKVRSNSINSTGIRDIAVDRPTKRIAALTTAGNEIVLLDFELVEIDRQSFGGLLNRITFVGDGLVGSSGPTLYQIDRDLVVGWASDTAALTSLAGAGEIERFESLSVDQTGEVIYAHSPGVGVWRFDAADGAVRDAWRTETTLSGLYVGPAAINAGGTIIDINSGAVRRTLEPRQTDRSVATSPQGALVATAGVDGITLISLDGTQLLARAAPAAGATTAYINESGTVLAFNDTGPGGTHGLRDLDRGQLLEPNLGLSVNVRAWLPSGSLMAQESRGQIRVLDQSNYSVIGELPPQTSASFATSPDDELAIVGTPAGAASGAAQIYDLKSGELIESINAFPNEDSPISWISFSSDGSEVVVVSADGSVAVLDTETWTTIQSIAATNEVAIRSASFNAGSTALTLLSSKGDVLQLDRGSAVLRPLGGAGEPGLIDGMGALAYSPDGTTLAIGLKAGVQLWDSATESLVGGIFPNEDLLYGTPSPDGRFGITSIDGHVLVWNLELDQWADIACRAAGRDIKPDEWEQYGHSAEPHRSICSDKP